MFENDEGCTQCTIIIENVITDGYRMLHSLTVDAAVTGALHEGGIVIILSF